MTMYFYLYSYNISEIPICTIFPLCNRNLYGYNITKGEYTIKKSNSWCLRYISNYRATTVFSLPYFFTGSNLSTSVRQLVNMFLKHFMKQLILRIGFAVCTRIRFGQLTLYAVSIQQKSVVIAKSAKKKWNAPAKWFPTVLVISQTVYLSSLLIIFLTFKTFAVPVKIRCWSDFAASVFVIFLHLRNVPSDIIGQRSIPNSFLKSVSPNDQILLHFLYRL